MYRTIFPLIGLLISFQFNQAQSEQAFSLYGEEEPLKVELRFDFKKFVKEKFKDKYQNAEMTVYLKDGMVTHDTIRIKARGNFRRRYCSLPPIKLNFKKAEFSVDALNQLEKVKLVTTCRYQKDYQQYLYKEFLAYKLYNELTPLSFRVRLVDLTFIDSEGKKKTFTQRGFIIEEIDALARRFEGVEFEPPKIHSEQTDRKQMTLVAMYQYMIGNTDWAVGNLHNIKLIKTFTDGRDYIFSIPYDFDYSGLVNATYAIPNPQWGIENVRQRRYQGYQRSMDEFDTTRELFFDKKAILEGIVSDFPYLNERNRKEMAAYLDEFFATLRNDRLFRVQIVELAREIPIQLRNNR
ncbi:MAG: hypothetical protein AAF206_22555 [Bacteroidota bacterium]